MTNKLALITGASSGIGAAFARHAAAKGFDVALTARRADRLAALAEELIAQNGVAAFSIPLDLSTKEAPQALSEEMTALGRAPSVLINNAGYSIPGGFAGTPLEAHERFIALTVTTPVALTRIFLPAMIKKGWGRIINISSITALSYGGKGHTLYPAGKSFLLKFSQSLNAEVAEKGVYVTAVAPGAVESEFLEANGMADEMGSEPRQYAMSAEKMVEESWRRNDAGDEVVIPGLLHKAAAVLMRYLPEPLVRGLTRAGAEKYYVGD